MTDPRTLTPSAVDQLTGRELAIAVEWWVFGDDLIPKTDDQIADAILADVDHSESAFGESLVTGGRSAAGREHALRLWKRRHGTTWERSIESHVAAWRADPRELTAELMMELLRSFGHYSVMVTCNQKESLVNLMTHPSDHHTSARGPDEQTAVFRAAVKVAMQRHTTPPVSAESRR